jgi:hypothetical protein
MRFGRFLVVGIMAACAGWAQPSNPVFSNLEPPDAQRTREGMARLLERYPPSLRTVLALDPTLLVNQAYLAPYPALASYLNAHPEVAHNPTFFVGQGLPQQGRPVDHESQLVELWRDVWTGFAVIAGFCIGIGLLVWLIRTLVDYRRWNRLAKVQADFHTKLVDRFTANNELLAYIQSPAGSKFLQSTPISLEGAPRSVSAPLGRILGSLQGGVVLIAGGIGLEAVSPLVGGDASQPLVALGLLSLALGFGFAVSATISYVISRRLGLIEPAPRAAPGMQE